jgi:hypothetical protein
VAGKDVKEGCSALLCPVLAYSAILCFVLPCAAPYCPASLCLPLPYLAEQAQLDPLALLDVQANEPLPLPARGKEQELKNTGRRSLSNKKPFFLFSQWSQIVS